jgi:ribosome biogenesis protein Nip4
MDTNFTKLINWEGVETYEDLADLFRAYAETFNRSDVTSRSGDFIDGNVKRAFLEKLNELADLAGDAKNWLYVRPTPNYTRHEGHRKNAN